MILAMPCGMFVPRLNCPYIVLFIFFIFLNSMPLCSKSQSWLKFDCSRIWATVSGFSCFQLLIEFYGPFLLMLGVFLSNCITCHSCCGYVSWSYACNPLSHYQYLISASNFRFNCPEMSFGMYRLSLFRYSISNSKMIGSLSIWKNYPSY